MFGVYKMTDKARDEGVAKWWRGFNRLLIIEEEDRVRELGD